MDWRFHFEHKLFGILEPNLVLYLRVDLNVSQKLVTGRCIGHEEKKDIYEKNTAMFESPPGRPGLLCWKFGWKTIKSADGGKMKAIVDIWIYWCM